MRLIIIGLYAVIGMILSLPVHLYFAILFKKNPLKSWQKAHSYVRGYFKGIMFLAGTRVTVKGEENLPDSAALYIANHRSYFDIIIMQTLVKRPIGFVAKKEFQKAPIFPLYMKDIGCLFLDRKNVRAGLETINQGINNMKEGLSIGLYPEGTRNHKDELLPFKAGGYRIAEKSDSPMVLTALTGFDTIFEANKFHMIRSRHVTVEFSKPYYPSRMDPKERKEFYESIPDKIQAMLDNLNKESED